MKIPHGDWKDWEVNLQYSDTGANIKESAPRYLSDEGDIRLYFVVTVTLEKNRPFRGILQTPRLDGGGEDDHPITSRAVPLRQRFIVNDRGEIVVDDGFIIEGDIEFTLQQPQASRRLAVEYQTLGTLERERNEGGPSERSTYRTREMRKTGQRSQKTIIVFVHDPDDILRRAAPPENAADGEAGAHKSQELENSSAQPKLTPEREEGLARLHPRPSPWASGVCDALRRGVQRVIDLVKRRG